MTPPRFRIQTAGALCQFAMTLEATPGAIRRSLERRMADFRCAQMRTFEERMKAGRVGRVNGVGLCANVGDDAERR